MYDAQRTEPYSDACPSDRERGLTKHPRGQPPAWLLSVNIGPDTTF